MAEHIIIVDEHDHEIGCGEKLQVHKDNRLHRAFSIYIFNSKGQMLIQQRNKNKYHSGGLWCNTCCSHPRVGEKVEDAVHRRLAEEMGFDTALTKGFETIYQCDFANGLHENEYLHVFIGHYDGAVNPNPAEAEGWKWADVRMLQKDIIKNPGSYSFWFKACLEKVIESSKGLLQRA